MENFGQDEIEFAEFEEVVARWIREKLQQGLEAALGGDDDDEDEDEEDGKLNRLRTIFSRWGALLIPMALCCR